jgi:hypothetical protein
LTGEAAGAEGATGAGLEGAAGGVTPAAGGAFDLMDVTMDGVCCAGAEAVIVTTRVSVT